MTLEPKKLKKDSTLTIQSFSVPIGDTTLEDEHEDFQFLKPWEDLYSQKDEDIKKEKNNPLKVNLFYNTNLTFYNADRSYGVNIHNFSAPTDFNLQIKKEYEYTNASKDEDEWKDVKIYKKNNRSEKNKTL